MRQTSERIGNRPPPDFTPDDATGKPVAEGEVELDEEAEGEGDEEKPAAAPALTLEGAQSAIVLLQAGELDQGLKALGVDPAITKGLAGRAKYARESLAESKRLKAEADETARRNTEAIEAARVNLGALVEGHNAFAKNGSALGLLKAVARHAKVDVSSLVRRAAEEQRGERSPLDELASRTAPVEPLDGSGGEGDKGDPPPARRQERTAARDERLDPILSELRELRAWRESREAAERQREEEAKAQEAAAAKAERDAKIATAVEQRLSAHPVAKLPGYRDEVISELRSAYPGKRITIVELRNAADSVVARHREAAAALGLVQARAPKAKPGPRTRPAAPIPTRVPVTEADKRRHSIDLARQALRETTR